MVETRTCGHCKGRGATTYDCCIEASFPGVLIPPGPIRKALSGPRKCCVCSGKGFIIVGENEKK